MTKFRTMTDRRASDGELLPDADRLTAQLVPLVEAEFAALSVGRSREQGAGAAE